MIKQCIVVALTAATALMSMLVAAVREEHTFEVMLTIPTRGFYIVPAEPGWIHQPQRLNWDHPTASLGSLSKHFDVRHDTSAIEARLASQAILSNGRPGEDIALKVSFNDVELSHDPRPRQVVRAADAAVGMRVLLQIEPQKPAAGYRPGDYSGNVLLLFNARAPGE